MSEVSLYTPPGLAAEQARCSGFRVQGTGCRVQRSGFGVQGSWSRVQGSGCRVKGAGCRVQGAGSRVKGPGSRVQGPGFLGSRVQGPGSRVQGPGFRVQCSWSSVQCSVFRIQGPGESDGRAARWFPTHWSTCFVKRQRGLKSKTNGGCLQSKKGRGCRAWIEVLRSTTAREITSTFHLAQVVPLLF